jgi:hypothetical protein
VIALAHEIGTPLHVIAGTLCRAGFQVIGITTIQEALDFLGKQGTDWVITDF